MADEKQVEPTNTDLIDQKIAEVEAAITRSDELFKANRPYHRKLYEQLQHNADQAGRRGELRGLKLLKEHHA